MESVRIFGNTLQEEVILRFKKCFSKGGGGGRGLMLHSFLRIVVQRSDYRKGGKYQSIYLAASD